MRIHIKVEKLLHHLKCLRVSDQREIRVAEQQLLDQRAVIRFHVIYDQIIQRPSIQHMSQIFKKLSADRTVRRIQKNCFFIHYHIRVIRYASFDRKNVFKQGKTSVASAHPVNMIRYFSRTMHLVLPPVSSSKTLPPLVFVRIITNSFPGINPFL